MNALFVKDGESVKFCFHRSVTQGRERITRDVERYGGKIVSDERIANVLLVDEQEDINFIRRRYYSSIELYRLSIYVEPRGFVQACVRSGTYRHTAPVKQGMPGRAPGRRATPRVPFTEEDRDYLAYYLATRCPTRDGRMGNNAYKDLERLGQTDDPSWAWASRHTFHSWREHYKMNVRVMDARIEQYVQRLKDVGHHLGHDPRSHGHRSLRHVLVEEDEEEEVEVEVEAWEGIEQEEEQGQSLAPVLRDRDQVSRDYLARHERDLVTFDEEEEDDDQQDEEEEDSIREQQRVKRFRGHSEPRHQAQEMQAKKARVSGALSDGRHASDDEASCGKSTLTRESGSDVEESEDIQGSDLFGDRAFNDASFDFHDQGIEFPMPFSARASSVPAQEDPAMSTQATLIASPGHMEKEPAPAAIPRVASAPPPVVPSSSREMLVLREEQPIAQPVRMRTRAMTRERTQSRDMGVDALYRNTWAQSRSVEPRSQPREREDKSGRGKDKDRKRLHEEVLIEEETSNHGEETGPPEGRAPTPPPPDEANGPGSVAGGISDRDEMVVEGLLEASTEDHENGESVSSDEEDLLTLPRYQEVEVGSEPEDSDDADTHAMLVRNGEKVVPRSEQGEDEGDEEVARIKRMARGTLRAASASAPEPRITRSKTTTQTSRRRTRSATQPMRAGPVSSEFPSPGTKARTVVDQVLEEERRTGYKPPVGSQAARVVKGRKK